MDGNRNHPTYCQANSIMLSRPYNLTLLHYLPHRKCTAVLHMDRLGYDRAIVSVVVVVIFEYTIYAMISHMHFHLPRDTNGRERISKMKWWKIFLLARIRCFIGHNWLTYATNNCYYNAANANTPKNKERKLE